MSLILINPYAYGSGSAPVTTITDSFNRANSTTTLGSTDTGQAWTAHVGTWGISSNQAYSVTAADGDIATVDFGSANQAVSATIAGLSSGTQSFQVVARFTDNNNWYLALATTGNTQIYRRVSGTLTLTGTTATGWANGDVLRFEVNGTGSQVVKKNGTTVLTTTNTALTTGNRAGLRWGASSSAIRVDNFEVTAP